MGWFFLFSGCSKKNDSAPLVINPTVNPIPYSVLVYLVTPTDKSFNSQYYIAARSSMLNLQNWYKTQLGNKTFVLNPVIVDTLTGLHNSSWFSSNNGDSVSGSGSLYAYYNTKYEMKHLLGDKFDTALYTYFVYVAADFPDETIPRGLAAVGLANLTGLSGQFPGSWIGADGHALSHAFGLHEPTTETSNGMMSLGWPNYPNCIFTQAEKDSLSASPFLK